MTTQRRIEHSTNGATLADLLERILDKGIVIAGDIKVKIVDIELLTVQIRLLVCSVDKAREIGVDWWVDNPAFCRSQKQGVLPEADSMARFAERLDRMEARMPAPADDAPSALEPTHATAAHKP
jgi:hypothetical protein